MENRKFIAAWFFIVILFQGCASAHKASQRSDDVRFQTPNNSVPPLSSNTDYGPQPQEPVPTVGPEPMAIHPVVLVLGPSRLKGFAYAGAIRALVDGKIPVAAIVSSEFGSLIGALYASSGNINQFEWDLQKVKGEWFIKKDGFFSRFGKKSSQDEALRENIQTLFGNKELSETKVPLYVGLSKVESSELQFYNHGNLSQMIEGAIGKLDTKPTTLEQLITEAKSLHLGPVVVIDVFENSSIASNYSEADFVLHPNLQGIGFMDPQKKTEAIYRGKNVVRKNIKALQQLTHRGIDEESHRSVSQ